MDSLVGRLSLFPFTQFPGNVENKPVAQIAVVVGSEFVQVAVQTAYVRLERSWRPFACSFVWFEGVYRKFDRRGF